MAWKANAQYIEKKKEEDKALDEKLIEGIQNVYKSDEWKNFLDMNENFRNFSVENKILVYLQKPDASMVKTANCWNKQYERNINKGERGIRIRQPVFKEYEEIDKLRGTKEDDGHLEDREKDDKGRVKLLQPKIFYRYISEFDVSQTNGKELPPHQITKQIDMKMENYESVKKALMEASPVPISFAERENDEVLKSGAYGYYSRLTDAIVIQAGLSEADTINVMAHEISHAMLHGEEMRVEGIETSANIPSKSEKEVQAESSAYMICSHLGLDTECASFGYVANYAHKSDDAKENIRFLKKNLDTICKCANAVIDKIDEALSKEIPLAEEKAEEKKEAKKEAKSEPAKAETTETVKEEVKEVVKEETKEEEKQEEPAPALTTFATLEAGDKLRHPNGSLVTIDEISDKSVTLINENGAKMKLGDNWREITEKSGFEIVQIGDKDYDKGKDTKEKEEIDEDLTK